MPLTSSGTGTIRAAIPRRFNSLDKALDGRRARHHGDALVREIGHTRQPCTGLDQHAAAVDEGHQAEIHVFLAGQRHRRGAAFEVDAPLLHRLQAILQRNLDPLALQVGQVQLLAQGFGHMLAQVDGVAGGRLAVLRARERRRVLQVAEANDPAFAYFFERAGAGMRARGERGQ